MADLLINWFRFDLLGLGVDTKLIEFTKAIACERPRGGNSLLTLQLLNPEEKRLIFR